MNTLQRINYLLETIRYYQVVKKSESDIKLNERYDNIIFVMRSELTNEFSNLQSEKGSEMVRYYTDNYKGLDLLNEIMSLVELIRHCEYVGDPLALDYRTELEQLLFKVIK
jgi:hypothetical protein